MLRLEHVGRTHVGLVREKNEDALLLAPDLGLFSVCDGMGGHVGGQVASQLAVKTIEEVVRSGVHDPEDADVLATAIRRANAAIYAQARSDPSLHNMGTTVVAVRQQGNLLHVCHVGDSRIYRLSASSGELVQITRDHSLVNLYQDNPELAVHFGPPNENVIVRAVGLREDIEVDHQVQELHPGDMFLLCCDGLTDMVDDWILREVMVDAISSDLEEACDALIRAALNYGGVDNITAILLRVSS
ncbi:MAG: protein phosphatase 2C domain-containing protein [Myxococcales bacterium]|nr:protein phosphatase 2C domain-containing protein [Myxococcota bacterium]MDW8280406.1 protein phosphatase 2C domain-containing protein [Myxococcales bacterium]